eukprot:gene14090-16201_t
MLIFGYVGMDWSEMETPWSLVLRVAVTSGDLQSVQNLLKDSSGESVNQLDQDGWTLLMRACDYGDELIVRELLAFPGIDVNCQNRLGITALQEASEKGFTEVVQLLVDYPGTDINMQDTYHGWTALSKAARNNRTDVLKILLAQPGIDVNKKTFTGNIALMHASAFGHVQIVQMLLAHSDENINTQNPQGWTALMLAAQYGETETVRVLLSCATIRTDMCDKAGRTAVQMAKNEEIKTLIRDHELQVTTSHITTFTASVSLSPTSASADQEGAPLAQGSVFCAHDGPASHKRSRTETPTDDSV